MAISDEKYVASTTFRTSGAAGYTNVDRQGKFPYGDVGAVITLTSPE
jgi:hypothetical protein